MPILEIQGKEIEVGDEFLSLSPEEQEATVDEIAASMGEVDTQVPKIDTSADAQYELIKQDRGDKIDRFEDGQGYDESGVPVGGNLNTPVGDQTAPGTVAAPDGKVTMQDITDEEGQVTSRAYEGLSYGDALRVYESLANHPEAETDGQTVFIRGSRVPMPEPEFFGDGAKVGSVQLGGDQILQAASNVYDLIAAGGNKALSAVGAEESIPLIEREGIKKEGLTDSLLAEGPVLAAGGAAGLRAANAIVGGTANVTRGATGGVEIAEGLIGQYLTKGGGIVAKNAVRGTGINAGTVAVMNDDDSGVFTGDDALVGDMIDVLSVDPMTGTRSAEILSNKINLFADAAATGLAASMGVSAATLVKKIGYDGIFKRIWSFGSDSAQEQRIVQEMVQELGQLPADATRNEMANVATDIADRIAANKNIQAPIGNDAGLDVELDPVAAFSKSLKDTGTRGDRIQASQADRLRNDIYGANLPQTNIKQQEYIEALDEFGDDLYSAGGREQGVESARSGIVQSGRDEVAAARGVADAAQADVDKNASRIEQIFKMDATVGQKLAALEKEGVDINIYRRGNESTEQVIRNIESGEATLRGARDKAYTDLADAIPDGIPINDPLFDQKFARAENSLSAETVMKWQDNQISDYKQLRLQVLPDVQDAISRTEPGSDNYRYLIDLEQSIKTEQYNNLDASVKNAIKAQKEEVDRANEAYYNFFQKGPLRDVASSQRSINTFKETGNKNRSAELTAGDRSASTIDNLFSNDNRGGLQLVGEFLQTPEGGRNAKPLVDIGIAKIVQGARKTAQTGGVGEIDSQQLISTLGNFSAALEKVAPKQYQRIEGIITNLRKHEKNAVELERIAKEAEELAKDTETSVLDGELSDFFRGSGRNRREITQGQRVFDKAFDSKDLYDQKVDDLIVRAEQAGPEARNGLKAAFGKYIKFNEKDIEKNGERVLDIANRIYSDQPEVVEAIETAFRLVDTVKVGKGSRRDISSWGTTVSQEGLGGIQKAITIMFGVLNPTATRVRTLSSIAASNFDPKDNMIKLVGEIASDSTRFEGLLRDFASKGVFSDPRRLFDFMVKAGVYSASEEDFNRFNEALEQEQMNSGETPVDDTEEALR